MTAGTSKDARTEAIARAERHSPFLRQAISAFPAVVEAFEAQGARKAASIALVAGAETAEAELRQRRTGLALGVALGDLAGELALEAVTGFLSDFADEAIQRAIEVAFAELFPDEEAAGLSVIALGKLGSRELNFSSDVDLIFLLDPATLPRRQRDEPGDSAVRIGRRVVELIQKRTEDGYVARVDLRLRPSPEVTPIVLPVNAAISYYESSAVGWERAAFIRARCCAGDARVGNTFLSAIEPFVWRRALDFGAIAEIRAMSEQIRDHYSSRQVLGPGFDLKRGRGGIREVEFFVHARQLVHGGRDPSLRIGATLEAMAALERAGHLEQKVGIDLAEAYRRLRTAEHRLQMVADQQTHVIPAGEDALANVARLHGFSEGAELIEWLRPSVERVGGIFDELASGSSERLPASPELLARHLEEIGFPDVDAAVRRIAEWRAGRPRSLRSSAATAAFEAMLPDLLRAIAGSADPMHALNRMSDVVERVPSGVNLYRLLEARPALARLFARILAHAPALSDQLARRPELLDSLLDASCFEAPPPPDEFARLLKAEMEGRSYDLGLDRVRRIVNERRFALGVQLIDLREPPLAVGHGYARVAEGALAALAEATVDEFERTHGRFPGSELVIVALGRLGGQVMTDASDLDIIYLFTSPSADASDGARPLGPFDYFNRLANRVGAALSVPTPSGPLYEIDTRLRPQGAQGMLAVSVDAFADYQRKDAWTWEHMALARARPVFGSSAAREQVTAVIDEVLHRPYDRAKLASDAASMRADIARHKPASGPLDVKLGEGGLVDLEFAVHVIQLATKEGLDPRLESACEQLAAKGLIAANIVLSQHLLTQMLIAIRLLAPETASPSPESCELMAKACGAASWSELVERHDEARRNVSRLWKRIQEGKLE